MDLTKCNCNMCKSNDKKCERCNMIGCGMCDYCKSLRVPLCHQCAEGFVDNKPIFTVNRLICFLVICLIIYGIWKYK